MAQLAQDITNSSSFIQTQLYPNGFLEIKFNRAPKYNCINLQMLMMISDIFTKYVDGPDGLVVAGILFCAVAGKAFCSGADIKEMAGFSSAREKIDFLHLEYSLQHRIFKISLLNRIPVIGLADGIVMGAGAGIWMATNIRIVTENTLFAMPEANIGLCPDAGAHHFLRKQCPSDIGLYLALTGARLKFNDLLYLGLATHFLPCASILDVVGDGTTCAFQNHKAFIDSLWLSSTVPPPRQASIASSNQTTVSNETSYEAVIASLKQQSYSVISSYDDYLSSPLSIPSYLVEIKPIISLAFNLNEVKSLSQVMSSLKSIGSKSSKFTEQQVQFAKDTLLLINHIDSNENDSATSSSSFSLPASKRSCPTSLYVTFHAMSLLHQFDQSLPQNSLQFLHVEKNEQPLNKQEFGSSNNANYCVEKKEGNFETSKKEKDLVLARSDTSENENAKSGIDLSTKECPSSIISGDNLDLNKYLWEVEVSRAAELMLNGWMLNRFDFSEGVSCAVGDKKGQVVSWLPKYIDPIHLNAWEGGDFFLLPLSLDSNLNQQNSATNAPARDGSESVKMKLDEMNCSDETNCYNTSDKVWESLKYILSSIHSKIIYSEIQITSTTSSSNAAASSTCKDVSVQRNEPLQVALEMLYENFQKDKN